MDETTHPAKPSTGHSTPYERCGKCARCASGTGRRPDPTSRDCWDLHLEQSLLGKPV